jgi:lipid II:glycine glycyltransferase (peptidoglycan interpeptide bridge formation enzyme)
MNTPCLRLAYDHEIAKWDQLIQTNPDRGDIFQTKSLAKVKERQGWKPEYWVYETDTGTFYATALIKKMFGIGSLAYIIRGPGVVNSEQLVEVVKANKTSNITAFAIKMEPPIINGVTIPNELIPVKAIQPNVHTIWVDLSMSEDEIFATFRQRARREIRAAANEEIIIKQVDVTNETMEQMYDLYLQTSQRAGFFIRSKTYHETLWRSFTAAGEGELFFAYAKDETEPVAGAFVCRLGTKAVYKDGGSRRSGVKHFAHILQWEIMKHLKNEGVIAYDLHGVPPSDQIEDQNHPLAGLAMFKMSFSQQVTDYVGAFDQVLDTKKYQKWQKYGQRFQQAYAHHIKKSTLY